MERCFTSNRIVYGNRKLRYIEKSSAKVAVACINSYFFTDWHCNACANLIS